MRLALADLQAFCANATWENLVLFKNVVSLGLIGAQGNSNPHYISDWTATPFSDLGNFNLTGDWDSATSTCNNIPSLTLQFFYSKINT